MNNLLSSYSKRRLVLLVEEFGEYIIENAPELKEQFKDFIITNKRFTPDNIPVLALMTLYPEIFKKELENCLKTLDKFEQEEERELLESIGAR